MPRALVGSSNPIALPSLMLALALPLVALQSGSPCPDLAQLEFLGSPSSAPGPAPLVTFDGLPAIGEPFGLRVEQGPALAPGFLAVGLTEAMTPLGGIPAISYTGNPLLLFPTVLDAEGRSELEVEVAAIPAAWCGLEFVAQAFLADAMAPGGLAVTRGSSFRLGAKNPNVFGIRRLALDAAGGVMTAADFNGDGFSDVVVQEGFSNLKLFLGIGPESFSEGVDFPFFQVVNLDTTDWDQDGSPELVVLTGATLSIYTYSDVAGFTLLDNDPAPSSGSQLLIADFDFDGVEDIGVADGVGLFAQSVFHTWLNEGTGGLGTGIQSPTGGGTTSVATGDLNGDGFPDLAFNNPFAARFGVSLGVGDGSFVFASEVITGGPANSLQIGDVDQDGFADLLHINGNSQENDVWLGNGDATFQVGPSVPANGATAQTILADWTGDGTLDLVYRTGSSVFGFPARIDLLEGVGDGTFLPSVELLYGLTPVWVASEDLNQDGQLDVLVAADQSNDVSIQYLGGTPDLGQPETLDSTNRDWIGVADFNGDGREDLVLVGPSTTPDRDLLSVYPNNGNGAFGTPSTTLIPDDTTPQAPSEFACSLTADFDLDGNQDLAFLEPDDVLVVLLGDGAGSLTVSTEIPVPSANCRTLTAFDMDSDGDLDLLFENNTVFVTSYFPNNGDGTFDPMEVSPPLLFDALGCRAGDFNGDGIDDLAYFTQLPNPTLHVLSGADGSVTSTSVLSSLVIAMDQEVRTVDLNTDGNLDIVYPALGGRRIEFHAGNGDGTFAPELSLLDFGGVETNGLIFEDFDGSGTPDILLQLGQNSAFLLFRSSSPAVFDLPGEVYGVRPTFDIPVPIQLSEDGLPDLYFQEGWLVPNATVEVTYRP